MFTIIGLGNPGEEYKKTRHNVGRITLEVLAKKFDFSDWKNDMKLKALVSQGKLGKSKVQFVCPDGFMNNSGVSVKPLITSKKSLEQIVVIYDDLDLPFGTFKISFNRSAGGHNGLASIIKAVKSEAFVRIRIGISPTTPKGKLKRPDGGDIKDFLVEKDFRETDFAELKKVIKKVGEALEVIVTEGHPKAMSLFN